MRFLNYFFSGEEGKKWKGGNDLTKDETYDMTKRLNI